MEQLTEDLNSAVLAAAKTYLNIKLFVSRRCKLSEFCFALLRAGARTIVFKIYSGDNTVNKFNVGFTMTDAFLNRTALR